MANFIGSSNGVPQLEITRSLDCIAPPSGSKESDLEGVLLRSDSEQPSRCRICGGGTELIGPNIETTLLRNGGTGRIL